MIFNHLRMVQQSQVISLGYVHSQKRCLGLKNVVLQTAKPKEYQEILPKKIETSTNVETSGYDRFVGEIFPTEKAVPLVLTDKEPVILPFEEVPGPKSLKYLSNFRNYLSEIGTQITAGVLMLGLNISAYWNNKKPLKNLSVLFNEYGPVVRFVSPVGNDIVLLNHPDHIQKVYTLEGEYPVRSTLDSLDKYRKERRCLIYGGVYMSQGQEWNRQRTIIHTPLSESVLHHLTGLNQVCDNFTRKLYSIRNHQDEIAEDLFQELHKWSFDCMGLLLFSKQFKMLDTELVYSQCDMSWLYHSLEEATNAIAKCEAGPHLWKLFVTPAWSSLVKHCDTLDSIIGKFVLEAEQSRTFKNKESNSIVDDTLFGKPKTVADNFSVIGAIQERDQKLTPEDISTVIMDMLLIGVNTVASSMSFLLYHLAKHQRVQRQLHLEIKEVFDTSEVTDVKNLKNVTPYLQACIRESLRLVPPIPILTRILSKNIIIDKYNIPRGTLIIMSTEDASLKESNYEQATSFQPERWLKPESMDYHAFASIPFGHGARKCLGQNIAEIVMSLLTIKIMQKYRLEYHYGDVEPRKKSFIATPNRQLKIRFVDRIL